MIQCKLEVVVKAAVAATVVAEMVEVVTVVAEMVEVVTGATVMVAPAAQAVEGGLGWEEEVRSEPVMCQD